REGRWQTTGSGDAGPVVRAAGDARHSPPSSHFEQHPRSLLPRLLVWLFLIFLGASSPPPAISPSGSRRWLPGASSTPHISAAGSTASRPRTRACPTASS